MWFSEVEVCRECSPAFLNVPTPALLQVTASKALASARACLHSSCHTEVQYLWRKGSAVPQAGRPRREPSGNGTLQQQTTARMPDREWCLLGLWYMLVGCFCGCGWQVGALSPGSTHGIYEYATSKHRTPYSPFPFSFFESCGGGYQSAPSSSNVDAVTSAPPARTVVVHSEDAAPRRDV